MLKETPITSLLNASFVFVILVTLGASVLSATIWGLELVPVFGAIALSSILSSIVAGLWLRRRVVAPIEQLGELADMATAYRHDRQVRFFSPLPEIRAMAEALEASHTLFATEIGVLKRDRDAFEAVLSALQAGVIALDAKGLVVRMNPAAQRILEITSAARGHPLDDYTRLPELFELHDSAMTSRRAHQCEVENFRGKALSLEAIPLVLPGKKEQEGVLLVIHDESEIRRLERVRKDFVANVSHELKTPLTSIAGYVETLLDGAIDDIEVRDSFLGKISANAMRLQNLSNDLLSLARLESSGEEAESSRFDPEARVSQVSAALEDKARNKGQTLSLGLSGDHPELSGDGNAYEQAVYNLIDNAINYTPEGGEIHIETKVAEGEFSLSVKDSGIGIPESEQDRIFERFYRVDKVRSRQLSGTGLGLAIVRHVANTQGGSVELDSQAGKGSTFTLRCPIPKDS